jgi:hypothetical protein
MAKKVRGHRANKPNDSFGTINNQGLYKGNYRKDVYEDEEESSEEQVEVEAKDSDSESFVETKQESPEHDYKKRYDDLKRHYDDKIKQFQQEKEEWQTTVKKAEQANVPLPKTAEELEEFKAQYPDVYGVVETVAAMQASERTTQIQEELEELRNREKELKAQSAYSELKNSHPDFDQLRKDEKFLAWLEEQPDNISDGITKNNTDVKWASRVIDLYKVDAGITTKKKRSNSNSDAATSVSSSRTKDISSESDGNKRVWKVSEIGKMKPWQFEKFETELEEARAEGRIDYNS